MSQRKQGCLHNTFQKLFDTRYSAFLREISEALWKDTVFLKAKAFHDLSTAFSDLLSCSIIDNLYHYYRRASSCLLIETWPISPWPFPTALGPPLPPTLAPTLYTLAINRFHTSKAPKLFLLKWYLLLYSSTEEREEIRPWFLCASLLWGGCLLTFLLNFLKIYFIQVQWSYNVMLISVVQQMDSVTHIHSFPLSFYHRTLNTVLYSNGGRQQLIRTITRWCWMFRKENRGNSVEARWLGLCAFTAEDQGSTPGWGTKIPQAVWCSQRGGKNKADVVRDDWGRNFRLRGQGRHCWDALKLASKW